MTNPRTSPPIGNRLGRAVVLLALVATACAPAVPDFAAQPGDQAGGAVTTTATGAPASTTAPPTTTTTTAPTTSTTTTTLAVAQGPETQTVGLWSVAPVERDESGEQFVATVIAPAMAGDVGAALQARVDSIIDGHLESQVGATLALWRSIEGQGDRDLTGSTLLVEYQIAGFTDELIALRFFSEEQVAGSGGAKREASALMIDLLAGIAVGLDDIVVSGESRDQLLALVQEGLLVDYFEGDSDAFSLWAGNLTPADLDTAILSPDGLEIWFDELEVGPPEIGTPVVLVGYEALVDILDPGGPAATFTAG